MTFGRRIRRVVALGSIVGLLAGIVPSGATAAGGASAGAEPSRSAAPFVETSAGFAARAGDPEALQSGSGAPSSGAPAASAASMAGTAEAALAVAVSLPVTAAVRAAATASYASAYRNGSRALKVVALTFDDGYSPAETLAIFRILQAQHVTATFFPYARAMLLAPALWRQIAAAGYPIGNHTYSHADLTHLSEAGVISELDRARATIRSVTGRSEPPIMRPPYGAYTSATRQAAERAGYPTLALWDVDTRDWSGIPTATIIARAIAGTRGSIVLMHAGPRNTPGAVDAIIANYRSRGYTFVTVPQLLGVAWP